MQQRVTDEQIDSLIAGETVQFTLEQLVHLFKFMNEGAGLTMTKIAPGVYEAFSMRRQPEWDGPVPPTKAEMTLEYRKTYPGALGLTGDYPYTGEEIRDARYAAEAAHDDVEPRERKQHLVAGNGIQINNPATPLTNDVLADTEAALHRGQLNLKKYREQS